MRGPAFFAYADNYLVDVKFRSDCRRLLEGAGRDALEVEDRDQHAR